MSTLKSDFVILTRKYSLLRQGNLSENVNLLTKSWILILEYTWIVKKSSFYDSNGRKVR